MAATSHNSYFDGGVQSLGFEPDGPRASVGVIQPGTYVFDTAAPERVTVVAGALDVRLSAEGNWSSHPNGTVFEVSGDSSFEVRAESPSAYLCEYL